jgi:hypothetical protein
MRSITVDEVLIETTTANTSRFMKIHMDVAAFYDGSMNKTTEIEMVAKTGVWGTLVQFYKPFDESREQVSIGQTQTIVLYLTDHNDVLINLSDYSVARIVLKVFGI